MMEHKGTVTLETKRLILRRFAQDDAEPMFRNIYGDSEAMRFLPWPVHSRVSDSGALLADFIEGYARPERYVWAVVHREINEPIGFIDAIIDDPINTAAAGYGIGRPWWSKGLAPEALAEIIRFFFDEIGANRVCATHDPRNPGSGRVMQKCGMSLEGVLRETRYRKGEYSDRVMYSILAREYRAARGGAPLDIRPVGGELRQTVTEFLTGYWSGDFIIVRGESIDIASADGFAAVENGALSGVVTYIVRGGACEIVSLNSMAERRGVGTALVNAVRSRARELGCARLRLLTTNDNLNAIGFYQKRGFELVGVKLGAIDRERRQKPSIPLVGQNGIPLRHELEFAMDL